MIHSISHRRINTFLVHVLWITILLVLPEVLTSLTSSRSLRPWAYAQALVYLGVFYVNYYVIIGKSLERPGKVLRMVVYNLMVIIVALMALYFLWRYRALFGGRPPLKNAHNVPESVFLAKWAVKTSRDLVMLILVIGLAVALRLGDRWLRLDRRERDLVSEQREMELKNLKSQINPHFLFNTLNSIYALIEISPDKARSALHELSRLLRYMLYDTPSTVSVKQETDFITNYINLMKIRLNPSIKLEYSIDIAGGEQLQLAPLVLVTIIENVFKHGIYTPEIPMKISIRTEGSSLICRTSNGLRDSKETAHSHKSGGIGLANLRRRLDLIYGSDASIVTETEKGQFIAILTINDLTQMPCHSDVASSTTSPLHRD